MTITPTDKTGKPHVQKLAAARLRLAAALCGFGAFIRSRRIYGFGFLRLRFRFGGLAGSKIIKVKVFKIVHVNEHLPLESEIQEHVVRGINEQNTHDGEQHHTDRNGANAADGINGIVFALEKITLDLRQYRQADENREQNEKDVVAQGGERHGVRKRRTVRNHADARDIEEKLTKLAEIFKIEDAEAEDDDKLRIHVLPHDRPLFHALFAHFSARTA